MSSPATEPVDLSGEVRLLGRLVAASNASFLATVTTPDGDVPVVHKPIRGERELWDFPSHTLAKREIAAHRLSAAGGFDLVPYTTLIDGPYGEGSAQRWVGTVPIGDAEPEPDSGLVDLVLAEDVPNGWHTVLHAEDEAGHLLAVVHADDPRLRRMAVFDALANNADRKAGHLLLDGDHLYGCDHGVTFHVEDKLRTLLWGWAGEPLTAPERAMVTAAVDHLDTLDDLLDPAEIEAVEQRGRRLLTDGLPEPRPDGPAVPWPLW